MRLLGIALAAGLAIAVLVLVSRWREVYWPGTQQGYEPVQPIAFSHQLHAGKLQVSCVYCHFGAESSRHAGIPAASLCMNCHRLVTGSRDQVLEEYQQAAQERRPARPLISPEIQKLYDALGLDDKLQPDPDKKPTPIRWVRVHNLPAFSCFDHRSHQTAGVSCQQCHGPVETMKRVRQVSALSMGWCVNCHRTSSPSPPLKGERGRGEWAGKKVQPSTDCAACHN